jgi:serralysin
VTVNLAENMAIGPDGVRDPLLGGFDAVTGTFFHDSITGDAGANTLVGQNGDDILNGGAGIDTVSYAPWNNLWRTSVVLNMLTGLAPDGVDVNLDSSMASNDGLGGVDMLFNFENVVGSKGADSILGNRLANSLQGLGGADTLDGGVGNDVLNGGLGSDVLTGGAGRDAFVFNTALGAANIDQITDFSVPDDTIRLENGVFRRALCCRLSRRCGGW